MSGIRAQPTSTDPRGQIETKQPEPAPEYKYYATEKIPAKTQKYYYWGDIPRRSEANLQYIEAESQKQNAIPILDWNPETGGIGILERVLEWKEEEREITKTEYEELLKKQAEPEPAPEVRVVPAPRLYDPSQHGVSREEWIFGRTPTHPPPSVVHPGQAKPELRTDVFEEDYTHPSYLGKPHVPILAGPEVRAKVTAEKNLDFTHTPQTNEFYNVPTYEKLAPPSPANIRFHEEEAKKQELDVRYTEIPTAGKTNLDVLTPETKEYEVQILTAPKTGISLKSLYASIHAGPEYGYSLEKTPAGVENPSAHITPGILKGARNPTAHSMKGTYIDQPQKIEYPMFIEGGSDSLLGVEVRTEPEYLGMTEEPGVPPPNKYEPYWLQKASPEGRKRYYTELVPAFEVTQGKAERFEMATAGALLVFGGLAYGMSKTEYSVPPSDFQKTLGEYPSAEVATFIAKEGKDIEIITPLGKGRVVGTSAKQYVVPNYKSDGTWQPSFKVSKTGKPLITIGDAGATIGTAREAEISFPAEQTEQYIESRWERAPWGGMIKRPGKISSTITGVPTRELESYLFSTERGTLPLVDIQHLMAQIEPSRAPQSSLSDFPSSPMFQTSFAPIKVDTKIPKETKPIHYDYVPKPPPSAKWAKEVDSRIQKAEQRALMIQLSPQEQELSKTSDRVKEETLAFLSYEAGEKSIPSSSLNEKNLDMSIKDVFDVVAQTTKGASQFPPMTRKQYILKEEEEGEPTSSLMETKTKITPIILPTLKEKTSLSQISGISQAISASQSTTQKQKTSQLTELSQITGLTELTTQKQKTSQITDISQITNVSEITATSQITDISEKTEITDITDIPPPPPIIIIGTGGGIGLFPSTKSEKRPWKKQGYEIFGRTGGKWERLDNRSLTKKEAKDLGSYLTDVGPADAFKLKKTRRPPQTLTDRKFAPFSARRHKFSRKGGVFEEKPKYRKDSVGERLPGGIEMGMGKAFKTVRGKPVPLLSKGFGKARNKLKKRKGVKWF